MNSLGDPSRDNSVLLEQALYQPLCRLLDINIAKGTTDPRVEFISQFHSSQILIKLQFQKLH